ncbi:hypothetical protein [Parabacteroides chongii]|uniref:hypothetical protein n=1 Tax=Parabacteroides chongii TaxID=2685834 RepID=UPI00240E3EA2|nr:hypothetical protein [Parabacteroides chongii]WFE85026.1 hypothetical protein P3L47_23395 [Parabacteroides chongii]
MNESNWHATRSSPAAAAKIQNTGRNHEVARKIAEMARHIGLKLTKLNLSVNVGKVKTERLPRMSYRR